MQTIPHGDASPQNLLTPGSESPADRRAFDERVALARFLVDHYRAVHPG